MLLPLPMAVPPQLPLYHFHTAPVPKIPPLTERLTAVPGLVVVVLADIEDAGWLLRLMVSFNTSVLQAVVLV